MTRFGPSASTFRGWAIVKGRSRSPCRRGGGGGSGGRGIILVVLLKVVVVFKAIVFFFAVKTDGRIAYW